MKTFLGISVVLLGLLGTLFYFVSHEPEKPMGAVKPEVTREHDGSWGWKVRYKSVNIPPTYLTCTNFDLSGSFSVALNSAGEAYFGDQTSDVNAAIAAAVAEAVAELAGKAGTYCEDQCTAMLSGTKDGTSNDAAATAQIVLTQGVNDDICWPGGIVPDTGIHITATAPGSEGYDLGPFVSGVTPNTTEAAPQNAQWLADFIAAIPDTFATGVSGSWETPEFLFSNVTYGSMYGKLHLTRNSSTEIVISFYARAEDPESIVIPPTFGAIYLTLDDIASPSGSIFCSYVGSVSEGGPLTWPTSFTLIPSTSSDREIDQTIPLDNTGGETDVHTPSGDSASLTASGSMTIAISEAPSEVVDPGFTSRCQYDYTFSNRHPIQRLCGKNEFQLYTEPGTPYTFPRGKPPTCSIFMTVGAEG